MKQIEINGILWDTENLEVNGVKYFTWEEANNIAKSLGKRVPTRDELKHLIKTGIEWDHDRDVLWFSDKKLSLPADGIIPQHGDEICAKGRFVHIWSSTINTDIGNAAYFLNANCADINVINTSLCNKVPVRLVQDISSNSVIKEEVIFTPTVSCNISVESIAKMQKTIDVQKNYLDYVLLKLLYPHKINHIFLDSEVDSTTFKIICEKLEKLCKDNPIKYLYVRGNIFCPEVSCPNYEYFAECEDENEIENNEAIAYFPEDKVPYGAIIIDGDLILTKELVVDGYTLLCAKEIRSLN